MTDITDKVMAHVQHLCIDIGHRPAGSPQNKAAAEYIERVFRDCGLTCERQVFNCPSWECHETLLELGNRPLEASANWRSIPGDVTGPTVAVGALEELQHTELAGRIAILYGVLTQDEISNRDSTVYYPPDHRKINTIIDKKHPLAVITVTPFLHSLRHVIKDPDMPVPSVTVMPEIGLELVRHAGETVHLRIESKCFQDTSWNVIGSRPGKRPERIVISAHYDTVWGSPGAIDNASGVGVMLTLAELLAVRELPIGLEFYASSGEEFGGQGTLAYLEHYGLKEFPFRWDKPVGESSPVWEPILAMFNIDGVGVELSPNSVTTIAASKAFDNLVSKIKTEKYPSMERVDAWPASDHYTFYSHGVPSVAFKFEGGIPNLHHHPIDTIQWISPRRLAEVVSFITDVLDELQDKTSQWCRVNEG